MFSTFSHAFQLSMWSFNCGCVFDQSSSKLLLFDTSPRTSAIHENCSGNEPTANSSISSASKDSSAESNAFKHWLITFCWISLRCSGSTSYEIARQFFLLETKNCVVFSRFQLTFRNSFMKLLRMFALLVKTSALHLILEWKSECYCSEFDHRIVANKLTWIVQWESWPTSIFSIHQQVFPIRFWFFPTIVLDHWQVLCQEHWWCIWASRPIR